MSEKPPQSEDEKFMENVRVDLAKGFELVEQDKADPVRGPIYRQARMVFETGMAGNAEVKEDLDTFLESFAIAHPDARRYRLYHAVIGSSPPGRTDLYDADGEIDAAMKEIAKKHNLPTTE